jgi:erythritol transport system substrate-binding protein
MRAHWAYAPLTRQILSIERKAMFNRFASRSLLAGAVLISLAACGGGGSSSAGGEAAPSGSAGGGGSAGGPIAVITVDPSNPYWKAEIDTAQAEFKRLGYQPTTSAHKNDPDTQNQLIETAINDKVKGVLLDPAGADESVAAVQKLVDAKIPVVLINAEISKTGLAKAQIVSNNAQGATLGAEEWAKSMNYKGTFVELFGRPSDNNAQVRSDGYHQVISQYPDLKQVGKEIANWDRQTGQDKMESLLSKNPDVQGVVAGNDEMALGAINALKDKGKLAKVKVLGFDGNQDAVNAVKKGEMVATVLQPIVEGTKKAAAQLDSVIRTGQTGVPDEKQALDCTLITKENADKVNNFVITEG